MAEHIVIFSPLPPRKSGIASYTAELLPFFCERARVSLVCEEGGTEAIHTALGFRDPALEIITPAEYEGRPELHGLPTFYQIGNNKDHVFVYDAFLRRPGILVQHDFNLHYLVDDATLARGDLAGYRNVLAEEYGDAGATLADMRHIGLFSEAQKLALPLNQHLLHRARSVIVHSHWVHDRIPVALREHVTVLPHHYSPLVACVADLGPARARAELGLPAEGFIFLSLGFITPPKQIQTTLKALGALKRAGHAFHFVIAGERNAGLDIDAHIQANDLVSEVTVTGYVDELAFFRYIKAADCLVNLRYPTVGESSGTLARALALGLPAVVHDFGPSSEFPDHTVLKVPLELGVPNHLTEALRLVMDSPQLRAALGAEARVHMEQHASARQSVASYIESIAGQAAQ